MEIRDKIKEFTEYLDTVSEKIKETEKEMQAIPLDICISFSEVSDKASLWWNSEKKRIFFQEEIFKPLIECKAEVRILAWNALERLKVQCEKIIEEYLNRIKSERKK